MTTRIIAMAGVAVLVAVAGCSSPPTQTAPSPPAASSPTTPNAASLDTGAYPTSPRPPLGSAGSEDAGRLAEGRRMAGFVVGPWQVDPKLTRSGPTAAVVITNRLGIGTTILNPVMLTQSSLEPVIVGFTSFRSAADSADPTSLRTAVVRVTSAEAATTVAQGLVAGGLNMPPAALKTASLIPTEPIRAVPVPAHPEATGILLVHQEGQQRVEEVIAVSAHGPYVLLQVARSPQGPDAAAALAGRTLDQQIPLIDSFVPTDPAQFASLPVDPSGLLVRTVALKPGQGTSMTDATYDRAGALQLEDDPVAAGPALEASGVDVVSVSQSTVYQAADPSAAQRLSSALGDQTAARAGAQTAAAVPGLPQSHCVTLDAGGLVPKSWCVATADRYAFKTVARQIDKAQQQLAAQYKMLSG
jgi:hypothetical protein